MAASAEARVFRKLYYDLKCGLQSGVDDLADQAFSKHLISAEVKSKVTDAESGRTKGKRTTILLDTIYDRIKVDPTTYLEFAGMLEVTLAHTYLAKKMRANLERGLLAPKAKQMKSGSGGNEAKTLMAILIAFICLCIGVYIMAYPPQSSHGKGTHDDTANIPSTSSSTETQTYKEHTQQNLPRFDDPFFGREGDLQALKDWVLTKSARIININGPPAFGKSTLAIKLGEELLSKHSDIIKIVRYIDTETTRPSWYLCSETEPKHQILNSEPSLQTTEMAHYHAKNTVDNERNNDDNLCQWTRNLTKRTVLILDNCDHILQSSIRERFEGTLQFHLARLNLSIVVVSQEKLLYLGNKFFPLHLKELADFESRALLQYYVPELSDSKADKLADVAGHCPLALKVVGKVLQVRGIQKFKSLLKKLEHQSVHTLSSEVSMNKERFQTVMDIAYKHLDEQTQKCSRMYSLFPGSTSLEMEEEVIGPIINFWCIDDVVKKSLIEEAHYGDETRHHMHKLIRDYFHQEHPVRPKEIIFRQFENLFIDHYTKYLIKIMRQMYGETKNYKETFLLNYLETHNINYFTTQILELNNRSAVIALGLLIHENLVDDQHFQVVLSWAYDYYTDMTVYRSLCASSSEKVCSQILWKTFLKIESVCANYDRKTPTCVSLLDCTNLASFKYRNTLQLIKEHINSEEYEVFQKVETALAFCDMSSIPVVMWITATMSAIALYCDLSCVSPYLWIGICAIVSLLLCNCKQRDQVDSYTHDIESTE